MPNSNQNPQQANMVDKTKVLAEMRANNKHEESKWLVTPIKKASRTLTNVLATAENYSMVARVGSAKAVTEEIGTIEEDEWETIRYFL